MIPAHEFSLPTTNVVTQPSVPLAPSVSSNIGDTTGGSTSTATPSTSSTPSIALAARPGSMVRVPEMPTTSTVTSNCATVATPSSRHSNHSRNSSWDQRSTYNSNGSGRSSQGWNPSAHSRTASLDMRHSRNSSADLNKIIRNDVGLVFNQQSGWCDPLRVQIIKAHHNWISAAYPHFVTCYRLKDSSGWQLVFTSPYIEATIERLAIKVNFSNSGEKSQSKMVAISYGNQIRLWRVSDDGSKSDVGIFNLHVRVEYLFFIGNQLVALSSSGKIGVWHAMTQHWQIQDLCPILSFDTAGSFLLLGCNNGSIYYIGKTKSAIRHT